MKTTTRPSLGEWLEAEPFALAMSSGFFGFYAHAGALDALCENDLYPSAVRGSSAGGLVAVLWAAGMEPQQISEDLSAVRRKDFWDPRPGAGLLKGKLLDQVLRELVTIENLEDCPIPAHVSVFDIRSRQTEIVETGDTVLAARATCAVPGLFHPVKINGRYKLDGGIKDRDGYACASPNERILHHQLRTRRSEKAGSHVPTNVSLRSINICTLEIGGMPFVNPFTLQKGMSAYSYAKAQTIQALELPVSS